MEVLNRARAMPRSAASVSELTGAAVLLRGPDMVVYPGALDSEGATAAGLKIPRQHVGKTRAVESENPRCVSQCTCTHRAVR